MTLRHQYAMILKKTTLKYTMKIQTHFGLNESSLRPILKKRLLGLLNNYKHSRPFIVHVWHIINSTLFQSILGGPRLHWSPSPVRGYQADGNTKLNVDGFTIDPTHSGEVGPCLASNRGWEKGNYVI